MKPLAGLAVIFDLDGTLIDTAEDLAASMNHVLIANDRAPIDPAEVRHLVGFGAKAMLRQGFHLSEGETVDEAEMDRHVTQFLDHYLPNIAVHSRPFPDAVAAMDKLATAGASLAICTNKREKSARTLMEALGLTRYFEVIVGSDTTFKAKPDPAPAHLCMEILKAERGVFIGDSDTDIKTALAVKLPCLFHEKGYGPATMLDSVFAAFSCYLDLPALVNQAANAS